MEPYTGTNSNEIVPCEILTSNICNRLQIVGILEDLIEVPYNFIEGFKISDSF